MSSIKLPPSSNTSPAEFFKYFCTDHNAIDFYEAAQDQLNISTKQIQPLRNENECLREQLNFALQVIEEFETILTRVNKLSEFKKEFVRVLNDSYLER